MRMGIDYGREHLDVEVREDRLIGVTRQPPAPPLADPAQAVRDALETPLGFPALRRALTPDDHVAVVVDEHLPQVGELLTPILDHVVQARVVPEAITLVCPSPVGQQEWLEALPDDYQDVRVEVHDPSNRRNLSYLATTRHGRRLYLNRTAVDADQVVVVGGYGYDPLLGYAGCEGLLYPHLSDEATHRELESNLARPAPGQPNSALHRESAEVAWLLGAPFMVRVIEGTGDQVTHVIGGLADTDEEGRRLFDARWRVAVDRPADLVVASVVGDPARQRFGDLTRALASAARVVKPDGRIVLLTRAEPTLGPGAERMRQVEDPRRALDMLRQHLPPDMAEAFQWANAAQRANIYLLSGLPAETAEELFTIPLDHAGQLQRLLDTAGSCIFLEDAHKTLAVADSQAG